MAETLKQSKLSLDVLHDNEIDLREIFSIVKHSYKLIIIFIFIFLIIGIYYAETRPIYYQSTAMVKMGGGLSAEHVLAGGLGGLSIPTVSQEDGVGAEGVVAQSGEHRIHHETFVRAHLVMNSKSGGSNPSVSTPPSAKDSRNT